MPTTVSVLPDSAFVPFGPVLTANNVHVTYAGVPGEAVFEHVGQWYQTTPAALIANTGSDWGRQFPGFSMTQTVGNSNDTRAGWGVLNIDGSKPGADRDHDGHDADLVVVSLKDVEDIPGGRALPGGGTGTSFWFQPLDAKNHALGPEIEFDIRSDNQPGGHLPNGDLVVIGIETDADHLRFRYDTGHSASADGFVMHTCTPALDVQQQLGIDHFLF